MIFDRTQNDVDAAIALRREKVQSFAPLTDEEVAVLEKGFLTINTLNRIESKQAELDLLFDEMGYRGEPITTVQWTETQIITIEDFERLLENTEKLKRRFLAYKSTPVTPLFMLDYTEVNAVEKILHDLSAMATEVQGNFRFCGTFESGE